jgi:two-component system sensor histidine kinase BarA
MAGQPFCVVDVSGEATASALSAYLGAFGYRVRRAEAGTSVADYASAAMICVDAERLERLPPASHSGRARIVVAVTQFGDETVDGIIANGAADAAISRPLLRSEIEELLRRIAAGEKQLQSQSPARRREGPLPKFENLRVLVADDNAVNREVATEALSRLGARVDTVENGAEAVRAVADHVHDIILMDGSMPQIDGFTAARMIRQAEEAEGRDRIPIVALTAHVIGAAAEEWRLAGMNGIMHKPFTIAQLAQCLMEQVPQFRTLAGGPFGTNDSGLARHARETGPSDDEAELLLVDPAALGQFGALGDGKKDTFLRRVIDLYTEHAPEACAQLRQHATAGEVEACGALAHSLKSMSLNIGAVEVAKAAAGFEQMARGEGKVPGPGALDALAMTLERTLAVLAGQIGAESSGSHGAPIVSAESLERDLLLAIERQELDVEYQPIVDRSGKQVLGVEALVRWRKRGTDNVPPSLFVPEAERSGFIHEMGEWVLRRACRDALAWPGLAVAVNVSPVQFHRAGLADRFEKILADSGIDPGRIELEITETALLDAEAAVLTTMEQLHQRKVSFALDDFGTGYACLTSLRRFPFDKIKIDRSFVSNVGSTIDATIVHAVVSIGRALGLKVVAEGVETAEHQKFVATAGVHAMQGYLFARPLKSTDVARFVAEFHDRFRPPTVAAR